MYRRNSCLSVRIALVGAGIMGADHAKIIAEDIPGAVLQVVCDASVAIAKQVADTNGAFDVCTDAQSAIARADVDAVLIASPDPTHSSLAMSSLDSRKPVLCEKPLAETSFDCLSVVNAERQIGKRLVQVGYMRRFDPAYNEMKLAYLSGEIGLAIMMHNFHRNVSAPSGFDGSMAITNSAPHEFDIVRYVLGAEIRAISAFEPSFDGSGACKPVLLVLETTNGAIATIEVNNNADYGYDVKCELVGVDGSVTLASSSSLQVDKDLKSTKSYAADWRPRFREAYRLQNKAWIRSIELDAPENSAASAWDGYCATAIAEAGAAALASGEKMHVKLAERPTFYDDVEVAA